MPSRRLARSLAAALAAAVPLLAVPPLVAPQLVSASTAATAGHAKHHHHRAARPYLALGDSVPFGYIAGDGNAYVRADNFVGYPMYAGRSLHLRTIDAACPGEATGGFVSATDPDDNGCRTYRSQHPLHVRYTGTQLSYAERFLRGHHNTALVSIMLGANDGFRLEATCDGDIGCILNNLPTLLKTIGGNYATIVRGIRHAGYRGPIVVVDYYSTNYADGTQSLLAHTLDSELIKVAKQHHLALADSYDAMKAAAASAGGNTCAAGLLNVDPTNPASCDVHPSQSGHRVLAATLVRAYRTWQARHRRH